MPKDDKIKLNLINPKLRIHTMHVGVFKNTNEVKCEEINIF